jgi:hypothetical protein
MNKNDLMEYHCQGERGEGGCCGASISELKAEGESAASAYSTEVRLRGHREGSPSCRTHVPIIELKRMSSSLFILARAQKNNLPTKNPKVWSCFEFNITDFYPGLSRGCRRCNFWPIVGQILGSFLKGQDTCSWS